MEKRVPQEPMELAVALTILEGYRFGAIASGDILLYLRRQEDNLPDDPNATTLDQALDTSRRVRDWVKKSILFEDNIERRIDSVKFFTNTAIVCQART